MSTDPIGSPASTAAGAESAELGSDERRRDFFASHGILPPRRSAAEPIVRLALEPRNDCVLLGPSGTGKTALISAFGCAGAGMSREDPQSLALGSLADLVSQVERYRDGGVDWPPTAGTTTYSLQLRLGSSSVLMKTQDSPGGLLFPFSAERWEALAPEQRIAFQAPALVLCVDVVDPRPDLWRDALPPILARLVRVTGQFSSRLSSPRPPRTIGFPRLLVPEQALPCERILVALTRVDQLIGGAEEAFAAARASGRYRLRGSPSRAELARHIDPMQLLEECVQGLVGLLRPALAPGARLAVGLTSAWGLEASSARPWCPFGVRECLLFLTRGECREPVVAIDPPPRVIEPEAGRWVELQAKGGNR
jgi:hypothetical protein